MSNLIINDPSLSDKFKEEFDTLKKEIKCPNILILGQTGVGKSSLINCIFGEKTAEVSDVKSQTRGFHYYKNPDVPVNIIDSEGYELEKSNEFIPALKSFVEESFKNVQKQVHLAWYCISVSSSRVLQYDIDNISVLVNLKVPVAVVFTKCDLDDIEGTNAKEMSKVIDKNFKGCVKTFQASNDEKINQTLDLDTLVKWSVDNISDENLKKGFIIAQKANLEYKDSVARSRVKYYAGGAAAIGASPIPMSDAVLLTGLQVTMTANILYIYGINNSIANLTKNIIQSKVVSMMGRMVAGNLIKLIPGFGSAAGAAINATVAATITYSLGYTVCILAKKAVENQLEGNELIENIFSEENFNKAFKQGSKEAENNK